MERSGLGLLLAGLSHSQPAQGGIWVTNGPLHTALSRGTWQNVSAAEDAADV